MDMNMKEYVNWKMSHDVKYGENEGYPLVLEDCRKNKDLKNFRVYGNSVQDGTPTPEVPIEIKSVGELTTKNLFDVSAFINSSKTASGVTIERIGDKIHIYGTPTTTSMISVQFSRSFPLVFNKGDIVIASCTGDDYSTMVNQFFAQFGLYYDSNFIVNANTLGKSTLPEQINFLQYISFHITPKDTKTYIDFTIFLQLEEGTATEYEPYHKYKIPVRARGKNLLDVNSVYPNYINDEGGITYNESVLYKIYSTSMLSEYKENTQYTFTADYEITGSEGNSVYPYVEYTDGTATGFWTAMGGVVTGGKSGKIKVTTSSGKTVKKMVLGYSYSHKVNVSLTNMVIVEGAIAEEYEPYIEPQTFNIYLDEPLRKLGNYADYVDFEKGRVVRQVGASKLTNFTAYPKSTTPNTYWAMSTVYATKYDGVPILTEYYPYSGLSNGYATVAEIVYANRPSVGKFWTTSGYTGAIFVSDDRFTTAEDLNSWIESNNVLFYYRSMNNLIQDIDLPELPKTQAKTMIYEVIDTSIQPSNMYGKYIKKH